MVQVSPNCMVQTTKFVHVGLLSILVLSRLQKMRPSSSGGSRREIRYTFAVETVNC